MACAGHERPSPPAHLPDVNPSGSMVGWTPRGTACSWHGQAEWNQHRRRQGQLDSALTAGHLGVPVMVIDELTEVHHGRFAGLTDAEINARHATAPARSRST
jgi:broad specificity phosphatase PhoE